MHTLRSALTPAHAVPAARRTYAVNEDGGDATADWRARRLEQLYRAYADRIYGLCLRMSGDPARAEELTQDVFVHAWEHLDVVRRGGDMGGWLWRLATNVVLNAKRSERRRLARVEPVEDPAMHENPSMRTPLPVRQLTLEAALRRLPQKARGVYLLHDVEGFSGAEIARLMNIAEGTVRAHLHRARSLLREALR